MSCQSNLLLRDVERVVSSSLCGNSSAGYTGIVTYTIVICVSWYSVITRRVQ